jgi:hypothetical protein
METSAKEINCDAQPEFPSLPILCARAIHDRNTDFGEFLSLKT